MKLLDEVIVSEYKGMDKAGSVADKIQRFLEALDFKYSGEYVVRVTVDEVTEPPQKSDYD